MGFVTHEQPLKSPQIGLKDFRRLILVEKNVPDIKIINATVKIIKIL